MKKVTKIKTICDEDLTLNYIIVEEAGVSRNRNINMTISRKTHIAPCFTAECYYFLFFTEITSAYKK